MSEMGVVTGIAAVLYLPWAIGGLPAQIQMIRHSFWMDRLKVGDVPSAIGELSGIRNFWSWTNLLDRLHIPTHSGLMPICVAAVLLTGSALITLVGQAAPRRREAIGLLMMALFPLIFVALCSVAWTPIFTEKLFMPSATLFPIFFLLPLGMCLPRAGARAAWTGAALLLALMGLTLFGYDREITKENWRGLADVVAETTAPRRLIIFVANDGRLPFDYYYRYRPGEDATGVPSDFFDLQPPRTMRRAMAESDLEPLKTRLSSENYDQVILVLGHEGWGDPSHFTQSLLRDRWQLARREELKDLAVEWYRPANEINEIHTIR